MAELDANESDDVDYQHELDELEEENEENTNEPDEEQLEKDDADGQVMIEQDSTRTGEGKLQQGREEENFDLNKENENTENEKAVQEAVETETYQIIEEENKETQPQTNGHNLRPNRERNYSYRFAFLSVRDGLRRFRQKGKEAILDELNLFLNEKVFKRIKNLTDEQALRIHCFLTEKRDGRIKARAVADGRTKIRYTMEETYSPTVKLESIMLCTHIEALEGRHVVTVDIKGAFLKAKVPDGLELIVRMDGELAEAFSELNPEFKLDKDGVLYLQCDKALYGHIEAARLFYDELDNSLTSKMGFVQNKYDPCVYNNIIGGDRVTIKTHVDDLKISAVMKENIMWTVEKLREIYHEITVHDGDTHDYLGMVMEHNRESKSVKINMTKYIAETIEEFAEEEPKESFKIVTTPATNNLFRTRMDVKKLSKRRATIYHSTVAKLLFVAKRARPEFLLAV
jgi:hypothetical protein